MQTPATQHSAGVKKIERDGWSVVGGQVSYVRKLFFNHAKALHVLTLEDHQSGRSFTEVLQSDHKEKKRKTKGEIHT